MPSVSRKLLEWTPEYAVNVPEIDRDHQILFGHVNGLHEAMRAGEGKTVLGDLLRAMTEYAAGHFAREEQLMRAVAYPEFPAHVQLHNDLRHRVKAFTKRFERGETTITIELTLFLSEWLKRHTTTIDRRIGEHLAKCGNPGACAIPVERKARKRTQ